MIPEEKIIIELLRNDSKLNSTPMVMKYLTQGYIKIIPSGCNCGRTNYGITIKGKELASKILTKWNFENSMKRCIKCGVVINFNDGTFICQMCKRRDVG